MTGGADKSPLTAGFERSGRTNWATRNAIVADPRIARNVRPVAASARDNLAFHRAVTEVVEERIGAGRQRRNIHGDRLPRLHDALAMQLEALELDGRAGRYRVWLPSGVLAAAPGCAGLDLARVKS